MTDRPGAPLVLDGRTPSLEEVVDVALRGRRVEVTDGVRRRSAEARRTAEAVAARRAVYGRSTGVGANRSTPVPDDDERGARLLRSHAVDAGPDLPREAVRAMLVVRLGQLARGRSGVRPEVLDALAAMLDQDVLPQVRRFGGIGTGDLPALAGTALVLMGEREPRPPVPVPVWDEHDALPFISSNALTAGRAIVVEHRLRVLLEATTTIAALSFHAARGNAEAFSPAVAADLGDGGAADVCRRLDALVAGGASPARIQDPYALRALPQTLGPVVDEHRALRATLRGLLAGASENPLLVLEGGGDVAHHGSFHAAALAQRADALALALASAHALTLRRTGLLTDPGVTGPPAFLAEGPAGSSGVMVLEYVAASALAGVRACAHPASQQSVVLSLGTEEDASFATLAVEQLEQVVEPLRVLLACELVTAVRACRRRGFAPPAALEAVWDAVDVLPRGREDRDLRDDVAAAEGLVPLLGEDLRPPTDPVPTA